MPWPHRARNQNWLQQSCIPRSVIDLFTISKGNWEDIEHFGSPPFVIFFNFVKNREQEWWGIRVVYNEPILARTGQCKI